MKTFRTTGTGNEQTLSEIESDKIPLYPSEQDLLDDLANLEVGQIAGTIDPAESELIGVLIQKIQALENGEKYSTEEVKTNKKWWNGTAWIDVYRKCWFGLNITTISNNWVTLGIPAPTDLDIIVHKEIIGTDSGSNYNGKSANVDGIIATNKQTGNLDVYCPPLIVTIYTLILEYTKTSA